MPKQDWIERAKERLDDYDDTWAKVYLLASIAESLKILADASLVNLEADGYVVQTGKGEASE